MFPSLHFAEALILFAKQVSNSAGIMKQNMNLFPTANVTYSNLLLMLCVVLTYAFFS